MGAGVTAAIAERKAPDAYDRGIEVGAVQRRGSGARAGGGIAGAAFGWDIRVHEHVRAGGRLLGRVEEVLTPLWGVAVGGCQSNGETVASITNDGFDVETVMRPMVSPLAGSRNRQQMRRSSEALMVQFVGFFLTEFGGVERRQDDQPGPCGSTWAALEQGFPRNR